MATAFRYAVVWWFEVIFPEIKRVELDPYEHGEDCPKDYKRTEECDCGLDDLIAERKSRAVWARALANELKAKCEAMEIILNSRPGIESIVDNFNEISSELLLQAGKDEEEAKRK